MSTAPGVDRSREAVRALHVEYRNTIDAARRERLRDELVDAYTRLVHSISRKFAHRGEPIEDVTQVGFLGLIKAIERFDPELGNEFTTFATPTIAGEIRRYFRDKAWAIRFPRKLQELYHHVVRANEELKGQLGRQPRISEVAAKLEVTEEEILEAMEMGSAQVPVSLQAPVGGEDDARGVGDTLGFDDENLERVEVRDVLRRAMSHLNERERAIMAMRFYDQLSQSEIARRLGISQMHVSRLQRAALESLRQYVPSESA